MMERSQVWFALIACCSWAVASCDKRAASVKVIGGLQTDVEVFVRTSKGTMLDRNQLFWRVKIDQDRFAKLERIIGRIEDIAAIATGYYPNSPDANNIIHLTPMPSKLLAIKEATVRFGAHQNAGFGFREGIGVECKQGDICFGLDPEGRIVISSMSPDLSIQRIRTDLSSYLVSWLKFLNATEAPTDGYRSSDILGEGVDAFIVRSHDKKTYSKLIEKFTIANPDGSGEVIFEYATQQEAGSRSLGTVSNTEMLLGKMNATDISNL
jgi:hypothetical protein